MIFYKGTHFPSLPHYPLSYHGVITRTMKISRIHLLFLKPTILYDSSAVAERSYRSICAPSRALMLVKQLHLTYCYVYDFHRIKRILSVYTYFSMGRTTSTWSGNINIRIKEMITNLLKKLLIVKQILLVSTLGNVL